MPLEIKKSYNPFKMWGSWVAFVIGIVGILLYSGIWDSPIRDWFSFVVVMNPLIWLAQWPIPALVFLSPFFMFLYGWGIHSIFRKLNRVGRIIAVTIIVALFVGFCTLVYINTCGASPEFPGCIF